MGKEDGLKSGSIMVLKINNEGREATQSYARREGVYGRVTVHTYVMVWQPEVAMWYAHGAVTTQ